MPDLLYTRQVGGVRSIAGCIGRQWSLEYKSPRPVMMCAENFALEVGTSSSSDVRPYSVDKDRSLSEARLRETDSGDIFEEDDIAQREAESEQIRKEEAETCVGCFRGLGSSLARNSTLWDGLIILYQCRRGTGFWRHK